MSIASEITRLQNAKTTLKTKLNSRNDNQHQITNELIDEYGDFVDSIPSGGGGIDWSEIGYSGTPQSVQDGYDYAKTIYDNWDSSQTNFSSKFSNDTKLIFMPLVNTSNGTSFRKMFQNCAYLTTVPQLNTSNGTNFGSMFYCCQSLTTVPQLDTSSGTNVNTMFYDCLSLTTFGGLKNVGQAYLTSQSANYSNYTLNLSACTLLTHDSLMNVINGLYDIATKGCNAQQLILGSTNLAKLSAEEIAIATNKGWTVS